jgi:CheY-like chemotaxis protein
MVAMTDSMDEYILIVEDNPDSRETLTMVIEGMGYAVSAVSNGREALEYLRTHSLPCLILLDLMMPVMDGWEFRDRQRQDPELADIPILVVSAVNDPDQIRAVGAVDYLKKPIDFDVLGQRVEQFC